MDLLIKTAGTALVLGATLMAGAAHAANQVEAQGFSARVTSSWYPHAFDMTVLSDTASTVRIALAGIGADEAYGGAFSRTSDSGPGIYGNEHGYAEGASTDLGFSVKQGYRIASFTLTGNTIGSLDAAIFVPTPGRDGLDGRASTSVAWTLGKSFEDRAYAYQNDVQGIAHFSVEYTNATAEQEFRLTIENALGAQLMSGYSSENPEAEFPFGWLHGASASVDYSDIVLTVNVVPVAAVPEPGTYAMLLGGLALLGSVARRRRN